MCSTAFEYSQDDEAGFISALSSMAGLISSRQLL